MRAIQKFAGLSGALTLAACATTAPDSGYTHLPDRIDYGRRMTISYAVATAANAERCAPIDLAVLETRDYNYLYNAPGVTHSPLDRAADAFIQNQYTICRMSGLPSDEIARNSILVAEFSPTTTGGGYLRLGVAHNVNAGSAFWLAATEAARLSEVTERAPWHDAFECRTPYTIVETSPQHYERQFGATRCLPVLSSRYSLADPLPPVGRDGLRGMQQPNTPETLESH